MLITDMALPAENMARRKDLGEEREFGSSLVPAMQFSVMRRQAAAHKEPMNQSAFGPTTGNVCWLHNTSRH